MKAESSFEMSFACFLVNPSQVSNNFWKCKPKEWSFCFNSNIKITFCGCFEINFLFSELRTTKKFSAFLSNLNEKS